MRILVAQRDPVTARRTEIILRTAHMSPEQASSGEDAFELARCFDFAAIVADLDLPGLDGLGLISRLREARVVTPVLLLTDQAKSPSRAHALDAGADDIVTVPFDPAELAARIRAVVRRSEGIRGPTVECGRIVLNPAARQVKVNGVEVAFTNREFSILELLITRGNTVVSKETILNRLYGSGDAPDVRVIDVFLCKLRRKLERAGAPNTVRTVYGSGYVLSGSASAAPDLAEAQPRGYTAAA